MTVGNIKNWQAYMLLFVLEVLVLMAICFAVSPAHGAVGKRHDNALGTVMYMDNPMSYIAGSISAIAYVDKGKGIVVRVQPIGTYDLFTEDLLFCGAPVEKFLNVENPVVLTYRTKASRLIEDLGCHELVSVDGLKPKDVLQ